MAATAGLRRRRLPGHIWNSVRAGTQKYQYQSNSKHWQKRTLSSYLGITCPNTIVCDILDAAIGTELIIGRRYHL